MDKIIVLGTGNATSVEAFNTCFLMQTEEGYFLTDTGGGNGLLMKLRQAGAELTDIHDVFISHVHMDHCLGVLWMIRVLTVPMAKGSYTGRLTVYGHREVLDTVDTMCRLMLRPKFYAMIGKYIHLEEVREGESRTIAGRKVTFFDIGSKKTLQYGYQMTLKNGKILTFAGDEPLNAQTAQLARGSEWLLREVLCVESEEGKFHAHEKKHDTVKDACLKSAEMQVKNVVLWHLEDKTAKNIRKEKYLADAEQWLSGVENAPRVFVPDDGEVIEFGV